MLTLRQQDSTLETNTMGDLMEVTITEMTENPQEGVRESLQEGPIEKDIGLEGDHEKEVIDIVI